MVTKKHSPVWFSQRVPPPVVVEVSLNVLPAFISSQVSIHPAVFGMAVKKFCPWILTKVDVFWVFSLWTILTTDFVCIGFHSHPQFVFCALFGKAGCTSCPWILRKVVVLLIWVGLVGCWTFLTSRVATEARVATLLNFSCERRDYQSKVCYPFENKIPRKQTQNKTPVKPRDAQTTNKDESPSVHDKHEWPTHA